jgi:hypothetical protein
MKGFWVYVLLCFQTLVFAQVREERPLPMFTELPSSILQDSVLGWSYSLDGQWVSKEKTILPRLISRNQDAYEEKENRLGIDNFDQFQLYPVQYGEDTLLLLVKIFTDGAYKYDISKKGWKTKTNAYYYLFKMKDMRKAVVRIDSSVSVNKIPLLDGGALTDVKPKDILDAVRAKVRARERYDRVLTLVAQSVPETGKVRFHIFSLHAVFPDVEGVLRDMRKGGRSLYGDPLLFNYNYYETDQKIFYRFFTMPKQFTVQTK